MSAVRPPIAPMLARLAEEIPREGHLYEPKWDGFRAIVFRDREEIDIRSRHDRPLARYFPELVAAFRDVHAESFVLDGEIVIIGPRAFDFGAVMLRLHPAETRVQRLARETPATFIAFDVLAIGDEDLRSRPFAERRGCLERLITSAPPAIVLTPISDDPRAAREWLRASAGTGIDGVMAKPRALAYRPGVRAMTKVKLRRTADCVVAGMRELPDGSVASLLLGLYEDGALRHVGVVVSMPRQQRSELARELAPLVVPLEGHPWERGFGLGQSPMGRLGGSAGRWDPAEMSIDWTPLRPDLVAEVRYDTVDAGRFRHPARFVRWRPDREPRSCTRAQLSTS
ncbi:MAG TPA: ATP-dependent DNA ligase [Candidatus Limnocylindrales bacterium]|nr:ATP-dependent DNA ligase [Candidatus Limnocylindrales bacterium]